MCLSLQTILMRVAALAAHPSIIETMGMVEFFIVSMADKAAKTSPPLLFI